MSDSKIQEPIKKKSYKKAPLMPIHIQIFVAIVLGQIACGFALGISGTALSSAAKYIKISDLWTGLIGAAALIGLAGSLIVGRIADKIGRRRMLMSNMYVLAIFSALSLLTSNLFLTFLLRVGAGVMLAVDYTVGNALLTEWLPQGEDSKKQSQLLIYWTLGFIASYLTGIYVTGFGAYTWQVIFACGAIPALVAALFRSIFPLPASPSWLANKGNIKKANHLIRKHLGKRWGIPKRAKKAKAPKQSTWKLLLTKLYRRKIFVGGMFYACQAFAFFGISIFLPILLQSMNITDEKVSGVIYNDAMFIGILLGIFIFNKISRRTFLISNFFVSSILISILAFGTHFNSLVKLTIFAIFAVILSSGLVLDYPYPTELFDIKVRGTGVGTCITISRIGASAGTFLLPILTNVGGSSLAMWVCGIVLFISFLICLIWAPETSPKYAKN